MTVGRQVAAGDLLYACGMWCDKIDTYRVEKVTAQMVILGLLPSKDNKYLVNHSYRKYISSIGEELFFSPEEAIDDKIATLERQKHRLSSDIGQLRKLKESLQKGKKRAKAE